MGVPGFFMWLWKKYKGTNFVFNKEKLNPKKDSQLIKQLNSIDYFLIDTNCMIHPKCFAILDEYNHITNQERLEMKMINYVIEYLENVTKYVNPKKGVYIAIDGVAPVAKIKQQRYRRFKSVHDRTLFNNIKKKHKKTIPNHWNNSAITPGTEFMVKLNSKIISWCKKQKIEVIYSSSNTPSEGEHKLLQFIRDNKKNKYSYVFYGLDADLLFLALTTGLDNIFLLREATHLNNHNPTDELNYVWIKKMRESILQTLNSRSDGPKFKNNAIKDFIFICYLLGNDFLPHLPSLDISNNGLDYLIDTYIENFNDNKYKYIITGKKNINQKIFNSLIEKLALNEEEILKNKYAKGTRKRRSNSSDPYEIEKYKIDNLMFKIDDPIKMGSDDSKKYKYRYYNHYYGTTKKDQEAFVENMVKHYLLGLKWVTEYYFDKCPSWGWYYPYDHPPFLEDVNNYIKDNPFKNFKFKIGKPLKPIVQLLCVLPPQSSYLLPKPIQKMMLNSNSTLAHLYPTDFEQDFIGKGKYWKAIPYLPPLEIDLVKRTFLKYEKKLSDSDKKKNRTIKIYKF